MAAMQPEGIMCVYVCVCFRKRTGLDMLSSPSGHPDRSGHTPPPCFETTQDGEGLERVGLSLWQSTISAVSFEDD